MTQEEKAIAYDEAIRNLRGMMPNWDSLSYNGKTFLQDLIYIFPELAESEDEKIKKEIAELVMQPTWKTEKEFHRRKELCDWLEKQPAWSEEDEEMYQNIHECLKNGWRKLPTDLLKYESWIKSLKRIGG